ncbi:MAG TPA: SAM-dependent methyltransferase [Cyanobacteria bacterium UBA11149]|nr:SAM-dependent methyltransferase [Cyanobacteria bacterium UBA11367]HBE56078.1 SAM-dependent methyltransferase [Cyanobacteria bacterium UBA11366]HBR75522.1 SAM-dependent methyltransferase [Cyanobacteria bacterium UBA11159]HBS71612.1 SAM-dependent methyltransferase [Cyanobacteria bacterium UBA11153]HBW89837.1 SAM-dependent methyltransferase [Cyanobacteria bacterium UBA11149]
MLLRPEQRTKLDDSDDSLFYSIGRFVTHVDEGFIERLTQLYRDRIPPHSRILDLMSSHVSHLPEEIEYDRVEGHGMNQEELARNPRFARYFTQDLNKNPKLPLPDKDFDAVLICVSVQYLQYPDAIFSEIHRILKPGGIAIISFSNRMFYQKAIAAWRDGTDLSRIELVKRYFQSVAGFTPPEVITHFSSIPSFLQMLGIGAGDPFYAIISSRSS